MKLLIPERIFDGYLYMSKRYPKAAKKLRIRKKWVRRFGKPILIDIDRIQREVAAGNLDWWVFDAAQRLKEKEP